ncbi:COX15/CtaA family protein [Roseateles terrae]|uniref:Cytochrome c oxidase assembly protein subunit 15 n=1 Tax=Roseateles terrae TaxID=431060 RepID=A0ABR6GSX8_9BURK|nr:COX15/CtaA family protein [Roseateles terrae]MBB3195215.1 cytochrome c oxidase assembly protein subunit 15 [Roseateles terrae]OWQ87232.1 heme A synthase [Roseateles terrae]
MTGLDFAPLLELLLMAALLGGGPLLWWFLRQRSATPGQRLRALTVMTVFLTFDLILFGAFTRLTDSGLGCPDWPGCYGTATPLGAKDEIHAAQTAMPTGPVTHGKAWVEMLHRYLASAVGFLILVLAVLSWRQHRRTSTRIAEPALSPWWATASLVWVLVQGLFGALTVTMKLFPAIVTTHLMLALGLLMLLAWQSEAYAPKPLKASRALRVGMVLFTLLVLMQVALGGWVSTNYAVLACQEFPTCQGQWWPPTDFEHGFTIWRELGRGAHGDWLPFEALTAIHMTHRVGALVVVAALLVLAAVLWRQGAEHRRWAVRLLAVGAWQVASGLSNVVLGWPLVAALAHTGGAAALLLICSLVLARLKAGHQAVFLDPVR